MKRIALSLSCVAFLAISTGMVLSGEEEKPLAPPPDVKELIARLGSNDYAVRKKAEAEIVALGEKAVPALREAMSAHPDSHVRFEAERLLHKIGEAPRGGGERELSENSPSAPSPWGGSRPDMLEDMLRRLAEQGVLGDGALERLRKLLDRSLPMDVPFLGGNSGVVRGSVMKDGRKLEYEKDLEGGIKVSITENGETRTFTADSEEQFRERFPDVYAELAPLLGSVRIRVGPPDGFWDGLSPFGGRGMRLPGRTPAPAPLRDPRNQAPGGFRLGVWIGEMPEALREHLELLPEEGVVVEDVVPGSIADRMGLRRMDIIRTLNGEKIGSAADIRRAISTVEEGGKVEAQIIRKGQPLQLMTAR